MKVHATQYAALCALIGMAAHVNEVIAAPTSLDPDDKIMKRSPVPGLSKSGLKKFSEPEMKQSLLDKNIESSTLDKAQLKSQKKLEKAQAESRKKLEKEQSKSKKHQESLDKVYEQSTTGSKPSQVLSGSDALVYTHDFNNGFKSRPRFLA
jgi:hypothetical protein